MWGTDAVVKWSYAATVLIWAFFLAFVAFASMMSHCTQEGLAEAPRLVLCVYIPVLASLVAFEWRVLKYTIMAQAMCTAPFRVAGLALKCMVWLMFAVAAGSVGHLDIATTGLVTANMLNSAIGAYLDRSCCQVLVEIRALRFRLLCGVCGVVGVDTSSANLHDDVFSAHSQDFHELL